MDIVPYVGMFVFRSIAFACVRQRSLGFYWNHVNFNDTVEGIDVRLSIGVTC
jgi:hypothetical protein